MNRFLIPIYLLATACSLAGADDEPRIVVRAGRPIANVSGHMTGACIEDVNHEIYGGIDSQMVFGESFQEPAPTAIRGFTAHGGTWRVDGDVLHAAAGDGPKLIADGTPLVSGDVKVQVRFDEKKPGLAGLILKVRDAGVGADRFEGYEVSLDPNRRVLGLGRHRQNWEPIRDVPCDVPYGRWIDLHVNMGEKTLAIKVDGKLILEYEDREHPLTSGAVGLRTWQREASFRGLSIAGESVAFRAVDPEGAGGVSGMWRAVAKGSAAGRFGLVNDRPFAGTQSQRITFRSGDGSIGVENRGLNRQGMGFQAGKPYEGYLWLRSETPATVRVTAESGNGARTYDAFSIKVAGNTWTRHDFKLTPKATDPAGRLAITLGEPGSVDVGHAFLQPGEWGRFNGLPVRKDVAEGLIRSGITVMRLGGLMANAEGYRWKNMIGPRDRRPPYKGFWYPHSSNGWGILDFLDFCEAAGFLAVVDLNMDETPQDLADFVEYVNGPADSPWGRKRADNGHPKPYGLKFIELGNEEAVDDAYWARFKPLAESIWAKDRDVTLIVGDFEYKRPIVDPFKFEGAPRIRSLAAHRKILDLAKSHGRPIWFDVHIWNHGPKDAKPHLAALPTFLDALAKLSPGADFRVAILEENSNNHTVRRAIAHAETVGGLMMLGDRVPIVCAANALQVDRQNDNGWDQGLVFLNPTGAWIQPSAYVSQMIARNRLPKAVESAAEGLADLDVTATRSEDGSALVVMVTNLGPGSKSARIELDGFTPKRPTAAVECLTGPLDAANTADAPERIRPQTRRWPHRAEGKPAAYTFPGYSVTILRFD